MTVDPDAGDADERFDRFPAEGVTWVPTPAGRSGLHPLRWADTEPFVRADETNVKKLYVRSDWGKTGP